MRYGKVAPVLVAAATAAVFVPVLDYPFLNWDDGDVFLRNEPLRAPGLVAWAFTTRYMEHYQPLAWLTWGAVERTIGLNPRSAHALSILLHAICSALVYVLVQAGLERGPYGDPAARAESPIRQPQWAAVFGALFWAIHPLRVEVVAWASALPYSLALLFALLSMLAWMDGRRWVAVALFALSLLARPIALGLPILWLIEPPELKFGPTNQAVRTNQAVPTNQAVRRPELQFRHMKAASAGLAIALVAALAESSARFTASIAEFGIGPRLTLAATAPWHYLWRSVVPMKLTPLDPLSLTPRTDPLLVALGFAGIAFVTAAAWRGRRAYPVAAACWVAYLALLVPATGLVPSGLQATADRYTYLAAIPLSVVAASVMHTRMAAIHAGRKTRAYGGIGAVAIALLTLVTWQQTRYWRDSVALWTHAVEVDSGNDVALYNLATALHEAGQPDEALARYDQVLAIVPGHREATRNRDLLRARSLEEEGNRLAAAGDLAAAVGRYAEAVRLDSRRTHAHAALGVALTQLGRPSDARPHLRTALDQGANDPAVPNALAYVLMQAGDDEGALAVLREGQRRFPGDANIARNIAMMMGRVKPAPTPEKKRAAPKVPPNHKSQIKNHKF